jgi:hypothetical protein
MRFYNVDHRGKHLLERRASHPSDEQGRLYFHTGDGVAYLSDGTNHYKLVQADGDSYNISADVAKYS